MNICHAKCCRVWREGKEFAVCEHQNSDYSCEIYHIRFREGARPAEYVKMNLTNGGKGTSLCSNIITVFGDNSMHQWMKDQCCYANPSLLLAVD
jgi:hypothetical protein